MPETETKTVGGGALPKHLFERDSRGAYETPTQTRTARSTAEKYRFNDTHTMANL